MRIRAKSTIVDKMIDVLSIGKALGQQAPRINFQTLNEEVSPSHFTFKTSKTSFNKDQPQFNETEKNLYHGQNLKIVQTIQKY